MKLIFSAFGAYADICNSRVLGTEIIGKNVDFTDGFEGRFAGRGGTEDCIGGPLPIDRISRTVTLKAQELKLARIYSLGNIRVQVKKLIDVSAVARQINHRSTVDRIADGLVRSIDDRRLCGDHHIFTSTRDLKNRVRRDEIAAIQDYPCNVPRSHARGGNLYVVVPRGQAKHLVFTTRVGFGLPSGSRLHVENRHTRPSNQGSARICDSSTNSAEIGALSQRKREQEENTQRKNNSMGKSRFHTEPLGS